MAEAKCGAKTRSGEPCQSKQMANGRCRMHGGKTPATNQNATKHGIYGDLLRDDELDAAESVLLAAGKVENELLIARMQLRRALKAQNHADTLQDGMEVYETVEREGAENAQARSESKSKLRDYPQIIDRLMARIESLEKTRIELMKADVDGGQDSMIKDDTVVLRPDEDLPAKPVV